MRAEARRRASRARARSPPPSRTHSSSSSSGSSSSSNSGHGSSYGGSISGSSSHSSHSAGDWRRRMAPLQSLAQQAAAVTSAFEKRVLESGRPRARHIHTHAPHAHGVHSHGERNGVLASGTGTTAAEQGRPTGGSYSSHSSGSSLCVSDDEVASSMPVSGILPMSSSMIGGFMPTRAGVRRERQRQRGRGSGRVAPQRAATDGAITTLTGVGSARGNAAVTATAPTIARAASWAAESIPAYTPSATTTAVNAQDGTVTATVPTTAAAAEEDVDDGDMFELQALADAGRAALQRNLDWSQPDMVRPSVRLRVGAPADSPLLESVHRLRHAARHLKPGDLLCLLDPWFFLSTAANVCNIVYACESLILGEASVPDAGKVLLGLAAALDWVTLLTVLQIQR